MIDDEESKKKRSQLLTVKRVTMQDVARESGVSMMTVSRVLAGRQTVDPQMRSRVLDVAQRLDYEPNALAINFARNRSGFIGVAAPFRELLGTTFFGEMMAGFDSVIGETDMDFALFDCMSKVFTNPKELAKIYRQKKADGLLIISPRMDEQYLTTLAELGVAFIVVGECVNEKSVPSISCDDAQGISMLVSHLAGLGHRDIAYIGGPAGQLGSARRRERAFVQAMSDAGLSYPPEFMQTGDYTVISGKTAALKLLEGEHRPTAIVAANDLTAAGVLLIAQRLKIRVPEDLSVTGFDDLLPPTESDLGLTTVHQPVVEIAATAARKLVESLNTGELEGGHENVEVSLVVRNSTAPPRPPA